MRTTDDIGKEKIGDGSIVVDDAFVSKKHRYLSVVARKECRSCTDPDFIVGKTLDDEVLRYLGGTLPQRFDNEKTFNFHLTQRLRQNATRLRLKVSKEVSVADFDENIATDPAIDPYRLVASAATAEIIAKTLENSDERDAIIFTAHAVLGKTFREIGEATGLTDEGARKRYKKLCSRLIEALQ